MIDIIHKGSNFSYDCPTIPGFGTGLDIPPQGDRVSSIECPLTGLVEKMGPGIKGEVKHASRIMKIRHEKMKKHQRKKYRHRHLAVLRKIRHKRARTKERRFVAKLAKIRAQGDQFDPKRILIEELEAARKKGYSVNVLKTYQQKEN